jgi:hypothetical protein
MLPPSEATLVPDKKVGLYHSSPDLPSLTKELYEPRSETYQWQSRKVICYGDERLVTKLSSLALTLNSPIFDNGERLSPSQETEEATGGIDPAE